MRRKRLNHSADTLCAIFCGWRLMNSYKELAALGSGTLAINALTTETKFNGTPIAPLSIAHELQAWFIADLASHNIPSAAICEATLEVEIELTKTWAIKNHRSFYIGKDGLPIEDGEFFKLSAKCKSNIRTTTTTYVKVRSHYEQWPVTWPN